MEINIQDVVAFVLLTVAEAEEEAKSCQAVDPRSAYWEGRCHESASLRRTLTTQLAILKTAADHKSE